MDATADTEEQREAAQQDPTLCLAFTNTVNWHGLIGRHADEWADRPGAYNFGDYLDTYDDLVTWAQRHHALSTAQADTLLDAARLHPADAAAVLDRARTLREAMYRTFSAIAEGAAPAAADLAILNASVAESFPHLRLHYVADRLEWRWAGPPDALDQMLWPIVRSAADLLTSPSLGRVRECANDPCGWLFLDTSRNHSRRWCSMEACGNRAKARRHYARTRAQRE